MLVACVLAGGAMVSAAHAADRVKVTLADLTWDEPRAIDAILKAVLEQKLDADVSLIAADQSAVFAAMDKGDGAVDVHPAIWSAAQGANIARYVDERKTVVLNQHPYMATDGFYIPKYMADQYDIHTIDDLKKPGIAKLFDLNGDGKGAYWPGAPGWGVTNIYQVKAKSYGLNQDYAAYIVPDAIFKAQLQKAYSQKKGVLFYYWKPEALFLQYDLVKLKEPPFDGYAMKSKEGDPHYNPHGCYNYVDPKDSPNWLEQGSIRCESPAQPIYVGYAKSLATRAPQVAAFLARLSITADDVSGWIYTMTVQHQSPDQMAAAWVKAHPDRVNLWLGK